MTLQRLTEIRDLYRTERAANMAADVIKALKTLGVPEQDTLTAVRGNTPMEATWLVDGKPISLRVCNSEHGGKRLQVFSSQCWITVLGLEDLVLEVAKVLDE